MKANEFWRTLLRGWVLVVGGALLGALCGGLIAGVNGSWYSSQSAVLISPAPTTLVSDLQQVNTVVLTRVPNYVAIVTRPVVLEPVIETLGLPETAEELADEISVGNENGTALISITVTDRDNARSALVANAVAQQLIAEITNLEVATRTLTTNDPNAPVQVEEIGPVRADQVQQAVPPQSPAAPGMRFFVGLGALIGAAIGILAALVWARARRRIHSASQVEQASRLPVLASFRRGVKADPRTITFVADPTGAQAEEFRSLRTRVLAGPKAPCSLVVTAATHGEGTTSTAVNLAAAVAETGLEVVLVDANLRDRWASECFRSRSEPGLVEVLDGRMPINDALRSIEAIPHLTLLPAGLPSARSAGALHAAVAAQLFGALRKRFAVVVIDTPPADAFADAAAIAASADGVLVVSSTTSGRMDRFENSLGSLRGVGGELIGVVLHHTPRRRRRRAVPPLAAAATPVGPRPAVDPARLDPGRPVSSDPESGAGRPIAPAPDGRGRNQGRPHRMSPAAPDSSSDRTVLTSAARPVKPVR